jgi:hypothetical protein
VFIYGGLKGSQLLDDLLLSDDSGGIELAICDPRSPAWSEYLNSVHGSASAAQMLAEAAAAEAEAARKALEKGGAMDAELAEVRFFHPICLVMDMMVRGDAWAVISWEWKCQCWIGGLFCICW